MTSELEEAVAEVSSFLDQLGVRHMLIGGLAVAAWGEPRATLDVDFSLGVEPSRSDEIVDALCRRFQPRSAASADFVRKTRVLPLVIASGVRVDCVFAQLAFELQAIERAHREKVGGALVPVIRVEDLILVKLVSERDKDLQDARALLQRHGESLDRSYLEPLLRELAEGLARDDIPRLLEQVWG